MKGKKELRVIALAVCLVISLCCLPFLAQGTVSASGLSGDMLRSGDAIEYFDDLEVGNRLRDTVFVVGAGCVIAGAAGVLCMLLWRRAELRRDRVQEDREGILIEIEQAEMRNRQIENQPPKKAVEMKPENSAVRAVVSYADAPLVPSTPVSMQPNERVRPRVQSAQIPVQPMTVLPVQPSVQPEEKPAETKPTAQKKYDLEDILREIREGTL